MWIIWSLDSLAVSQIESDPWPPHSRPPQMVCFWPSAAQLSRQRHSESRPCFHRGKWKVHNLLLIAVPWAVEQPQLNTGQSWLPANLSNKSTSSLHPPLKECYQIFLPPVSHSLWHQLPGTQIYSIYTGYVAGAWREQHMYVYLSFISSCGNREGLAFCFPRILSDKLVYLYSFSCRSARTQKECVLLSLSKFLHMWWSTHDDTHQRTDLTHDEHRGPSWSLLKERKHPLAGGWKNSGQKAIVFVLPFIPAIVSSSPAHISSFYFPLWA